MAAVAAYPTAALSPETGVNAPLTADEFLRLKEEGFFGPHRVELLHGLVIIKMPTSTLHLKALAKVLHALGVYRSEEIFLAAQSTVKLGEHEAPEPDAFLVRGDVDNANETITPDQIVLAVEISISTLRKDRNDKATIYAEAGIPEYWIVNPVARQVEIRREPRDGEYQEIYVVDDVQEVSPLFASEQTVSTGALMPKTNPPS